MPIVNVHATKVIRGLRNPFVGTKKNINLTEDEIRICKMFGATVEYVGEQPKVVETVVEPTQPVESSKFEEIVDDVVPVGEVVDELAEVVEPVEEKTEEEAPVEEVQEKAAQPKSNKKKNK